MIVISVVSLCGKIIFYIILDVRAIGWKVKLFNLHLFTAKEDHVLESAYLLWKKVKSGKLNFPKSIQTFYTYVHKGYFSSINDEMLPRAYSYKPRKRTNENPTIRFDNIIRTGRTLKEMNEYIENHPDTNIVEMDTV